MIRMSKIYTSHIEIGYAIYSLIKKKGTYRAFIQVKESVAQGRVD